jgi:RNA polymerase sigma-70 factor, ECF subfamily
MVNHDEEASLVEASCRGDSEAFTALVMRYQRMIHALTFRMSGSAEDAADLAQETFVRAWHNIECFQGQSRFSSWIYRIAVNVCLSWNSQRRRETEAQTRYFEEQLMEEASNQSLSNHIVQEALMKLPAKQRAAIVLTVYEELNHAETAKILGCSEATVSWRVFTARRKLKRLLKGFARRQQTDEQP